MKFILPILPITLKQSIKTRLLHTLHAKPEITSRIATRVVREGLPRFFGWTYEDEKRETLRFVESLRVSDYAYKFALSSRKPTLYGSNYACMLLGMHGELENTSDSFKCGWVEYFDSFQDPNDGLFRDPMLASPAYEGAPAWGDGWGVRHLTSQLLIAYARLGRIPRYSFKFLEPYYDVNFLNSWLMKFDFSVNVWPQSNYIMNVYTLMQYARDYMGEKRAAQAVETIKMWLLDKQRMDTGMWHDYALEGYPEIGDAIRGAYHFYPLFVYDGHSIPYTDSLIDTILCSQNSWGGFNPEESPSGACEDIDAIEPLIRASMQSKHRKEEVENAIRRALVWIMACRNKDGGFESIPEHANHYGNHPLTTSQAGESSLFATWFRSLCLAYIADFLAVPNSYKLGFYPGYEIHMRNIQFVA